MELTKFRDNLRDYLYAHNINYYISSVYILQNGKTIYVANLGFREEDEIGDWSEPTMDNYQELRKKTQTIQIQNKKYINTYIVEHLEEDFQVNELQIWFK